MKRDYLKTDFNNKIIGRKDSIKPKLRRKTINKAKTVCTNIPDEQYSAAELQSFMNKFNSLCNKSS